MIQTNVVGMRLQAKRKRSGLLWAVGCIFDRLIHCKSCSGSLTKHLFRENKMFFVNKSSCISIMKSFSSTVVKDILSSPLGEDCTEEEEWPAKRATGYL